MNILLYAVPAAAAVALLFAFIKARGIARHGRNCPRHKRRRGRIP